MHMPIRLEIYCAAMNATSDKLNAIDENNLSSVKYYKYKLNGDQHQEYIYTLSDKLE